VCVAAANNGMVGLPHRQRHRNALKRSDLA
jgi:hypothetical protein